jgi:hypothetical protein
MSIYSMLNLSLRQKDLDECIKEARRPVMTLMATNPGRVRKTRNFYILSISLPTFPAMVVKNGAGWTRGQIMVFSFILSIPTQLIWPLPRELYRYAIMGK